MKTLLFIPVEEKFISKWEYYQVDHEALLQLFPNVIVCTSIWQIIKNCWNANLIYCWWWNRSLHVILLAKLFRIKTFVTGAVHMFDVSGEPDFYRKNFLYKLFTRLSFAFADKNLFISDDQFLQITSHLKVNNPVVVRSSLTKSHNFSPFNILNERNNFRREVINSAGKTKFVTVTWHTLSSYKRKGVFQVLEGLALLKEKTILEFEWSIVGKEGDGLELLRLKIKELQLENYVNIVIDVSLDEKKKFYLTSDLYIQPSWCEGFGNSVLEAMSHGLPALVSRYTAQPEVVGDSGFILMNIKPEDICKTLLKFMKMDDIQRELVTKSVLEMVEGNFTFKKRVLELNKVFIDAKVNINENVQEIAN